MIASRDDATDEGFSLIELLVVITVLPLVMGAVAVAIIAVLSNSNTTSSSLTTSGDAQVSSVNFVPDVQGAVWITQDPFIKCAPVGGGVPLFSVSRDVTTPIKDIVSYVEFKPAGSSKTTLVRETCTNGNFSSPISEVLSHDFSTTSTLTITPTPPNSLQTGWLATVGISSIKLRVNEPSTGPNSTPFTYALTATPRARGALGTVGTFIPGGGGSNGGGFVTPILPVEFLGACPGVTLGGSGSIVNSGKGSGFIGFEPSSSQCPNPTKGSPPGQIQSDPNYVFSAGDPFAHLAPPTAPNVPAGGGGCSAGSTITCSTGTYTAASANFGGGTLKAVTAKFDPSTQPSPNVFVFNVPVTIQNANVTFEGGPSVSSVTYVFEKGLSISTHSTVTFGTATYIFQDPGLPGQDPAFTVDSASTISEPVNSAGLLFYAEPGNESISLNGGTTGSIAGAASPYDGIAVWDAASGQFTMGGNSGVATSFGGIYDPNGSVHFTGSSGVNAQFMIVSTATVDGGTVVTMTG